MARLCLVCLRSCTLTMLCPEAHPRIGLIRKYTRRITIEGKTPGTIARFKNTAFRKSHNYSTLILKECLVLWIKLTDLNERSSAIGDLHAQIQSVSLPQFTRLFCLLSSKILQNSLLDLYLVDIRRYKLPFFAKPVHKNLIISNTLNLFPLFKNNYCT